MSTYQIVHNGECRVCHGIVDKKHPAGRVSFQDGIATVAVNVHIKDCMCDKRVHKNLVAGTIIGTDHHRFITTRRM